MQVIFFKNVENHENIQGAELELAAFFFSVGPKTHVGPLQSSGKV